MSQGREADTRSTSLQDGNKQLIPGIPDEITLFQIIPKLPWKSFHILSSVSRAWLQGIQTRQVYDARVVSHSAETLLIVYYRFESVGFPTVALWSPKDLSLTRLPPIPYHGDDYQWVSLDGKIYLVAGKELEEGEEEYEYGRSSNRVFVFDVARQGQWKECASLHQPRADFGCGTMHGKLYMFGGIPHKNIYKTRLTSCGSEVYDPEEDSWSPIRPMTTLRCDHRVEAVGDELFMLGGFVYDHSDIYLRRANFLEVYHPLKDEWRVVNLSGNYRDHFLFVARGKLYSMDWSSIDLYDAKDNLFTHLHSFSIPVTAPADHFTGTRIIRAVVAV